MFRKAPSFGAMLLLVGVWIVVAPNLSLAQRPMGGRIGSGSGVGGNFGGFRGGTYGSAYRGGYIGHPYVHNGYSYGGSAYHGGLYSRPFDRYRNPSHFSGLYNYPYAQLRYNYGGNGYGRYLPYYSGYNYYPYGGYYGFYNPYDYAVPGVKNYSGYYVPNSDATRSYPDSSRTFAPPATTQSETGAALTVSLPAGAQLWLKNTPMTSTGLVREFEVPPLTPGNRYTYEVKASWNENGSEVTQTQMVGVTAGAHVRVGFPVAGSVSAT